MAHNKENILANPPLPPGEGRGEGRHRRTTLKARRLRKNPTDAEKLLWHKIRDRQLNGFKFKRQYPLWNYVADFVCSELFLIVEVDGGQHNENKKDEIRTAFLENKGYVVIRFWNNEVLENIEGVVQSLTLTLSRRERGQEESNMVHNKKSISTALPLPLAGEGRGEGVWRYKRRTSAIKAKKLRKDPTDAEKLLWQKIRDRQLNGFKFKRQYPVERYIVDFVCVEEKLVVEVDGGQHNENEKDEIRTAFLESKGYEVVRFWNNDVLGNIEGVLDTLTLTLSRKKQERGSESEIKNVPQ